MLEEFTINCKNGTEFRQQCKNFNVNMTVKIRTLHKKDTCYNAKFMYSFIPFDTIEEVENFEQKFQIPFRRCKKCFP